LEDYEYLLQVWNEMGVKQLRHDADVQWFLRGAPFSGQGRYAMHDVI